MVSQGRALLVDDEDLVRLSTADMLAELGFDVLEAGSAEEALAVCAGITNELGSPPARMGPSLASAAADMPGTSRTRASIRSATAR